MEIVVGRGRGYKPVEEKDKKSYDLGTIVVDSVYTPVKDVGYKIEYTRVGDITNFEKLILTIETNGTISPQEAMRQSTEILMNHFTIIMDSAEAAGEKISSAAKVEATEEVAAEEVAAEPVAEEEEKPKAKKSKKK
jgi:DNA-directed RNA polymerase alpha subunit